MPNKQNILADVIAIVRSSAKKDIDRISGTSLILTELDFDSIQMIELNETLKERFGFDAFIPPNSLDDLSSPDTIALAILRTRALSFNESNIKHK